MDVYICMYECVYMYTHIHMYVYIYISHCIHSYDHTYTQMYIYNYGIIGYGIVTCKAEVLRIVTGIT